MKVNKSINLKKSTCDFNKTQHRILIGLKRSSDDKPQQGRGERMAHSSYSPEF